MRHHESHKLNHLGLLIWMFVFKDFEQEKGKLAAVLPHHFSPEAQA